MEGSGSERVEVLLGMRNGSHRGPRCGTWAPRWMRQTYLERKLGEQVREEAGRPKLCLDVFNSGCLPDTWAEQIIDMVSLECRGRLKSR